MQIETRLFPYHANKEIHVESSVIPQAGAKQFLRHIHPSQTSFLPRKLKLSRRLKQDKQLSTQTEAGQLPSRAVRNRPVPLPCKQNCMRKKRLSRRMEEDDRHTMQAETRDFLTTHTKTTRFPYHANQKIHANILVTMQTEAR